jgi:signal transduction histidine kinase
VTSGNLDQRLKAARKQLDDVLQPAGDSLQSPPETLQSVLADLVAALTELQSTQVELHQQTDTLHQYNKLIEQQQQQLEQTHLLKAFTHQIRQSVYSQDVLNQAVAAVRHMLRVDRAIIYRVDANGTAIATVEATQPGYGFISSSTANAPLFREPLSRWQGQAQVIHNTEQIASSTLSPVVDAAVLADQVQQAQIQALVAVPIRREAQILGIFCVHQCAEPRYWQPFEVSLLEQLADEVAIVLQQTELYEKAQQLNIELERQVQQRTEQVQKALDFESMLKRITDKVRDSLDEDQILQAAVQELTSILKLSGCNASLYNLSQGTSTICYEYTTSAPAYFGRVAQMDNFPEIYQQLQQGYSFQFCSIVPNPDRGRVAILACPIFVDPTSSQGIEQAVLGDLWLIHRPDYIFSEFEIRLVQQVANQCAIAIRQARLYQAAQGQVQELAKLNRLKDEFLSTISHELRTPITKVKLAIEMLKWAPTPQKRQAYLEVLEKESNREAELINDLLDLQQLEASSFPVVLEPISLQHLLPSLAEVFHTRLETQEQTLQLQYSKNLPMIVSDLNILRRILTELINNACKYTKRGGELSLSAALAPHAHTVNLFTCTFTVRNQAQIPAAELPQIFEKFYRCSVSDPWSYAGTGLGLALVQKLVERLDGTIQAESVAGWTTMTVQVPVRTS